MYKYFNYKIKNKDLSTIYFMGKILSSVVLICGFLLGISIYPTLAQESSNPEVKMFPLSSIHLLDSPFKQRLRVDEQYMMSLDPDRLLAPFRKSAGLKPKARQYGGWESSQLAGAFGGQYLSGLALMYAATGDERVKQRLDYMINQLRICQKEIGTGYIGGIPEGHKLWNEIANGKIDASLFSLNGVWSPWYNLHMTFKGLRDAWRYTGNRQARQ